MKYIQNTIRQEEEDKWTSGMYYSCSISISKKWKINEKKKKNK